MDVQDKILPSIDLKIEEAVSDEDIASCFQVITEDLRPHIKSVDELVSKVKRQRSEYAYRLMFIRDEDRDRDRDRNRDRHVVAILGYRIIQGSDGLIYIEVDDIATLKAARGQGLGGKMLDWILGFAQGNGYYTVQMDAGYERHSAHRIFAKKGFVLTYCHFKILIG